MGNLYSTRVRATGGRHGSIRSKRPASRPQLGIASGLRRKGGATNPEELFAVCYAPCFENALLPISRAAGFRFGNGDIEVVAEIGLSKNPAGRLRAIRSACRAGDQSPNDRA